ncbi:MAG: response regulator [Nitrospira sp.]|jgi:CheY-like chemotaxis protein|nr:response regulator [Nitrospira sp.]
MKKTAAGPAGAEQAAGTILVVDDEPAVCYVTGEMLKQQGFPVLCAENGEQALRLFAEHRERIALLLTDIAMPKLSGPQLAQQLRAQRPGLPVLFISGVVSPANFEGIMGGWLITKPYGPSSLAAKIREVLRASVSGL